MELRNYLSIPAGDRRYLQPFQEVACLSGDAVGNVVCNRGDRVNGKWRVERADPGDETKMPGFGLLIDKSTPTVGTIQIYGPVVGVFTGLTPGKVYCVDYTGIRIGPPSIGGSGYSFRQFCGIAVASDILLLSLTPEMVKQRT